MILSVAVASLGTVSAFAQEAAVNAETDLAGETMHQVLMQKFLEGGWAWMLPILVCLVIGLAIAIERILFLTFSNINSKKFIAKVEDALNKNGIEAAKEVCRNTKGPIASIYYQGLDRYDQGLDAVEKAVVSYGSVQTGQMESGLSWIGRPLAHVGIHGYRGRHDRRIRPDSGCWRYLSDAGCRRYQGRPSYHPAGSYLCRDSAAVLQLHRI